MTQTIFEQLRAPFSPERVSWRVGPTAEDGTRGLALAYIDARDVADRLDEVCGPAGWQNRYSHANGKTVCDLGILCDGQWIWKADGAGDTDVEAEKGALSDAFKRAGVRWGIGRYLYDVESVWVETEGKGKVKRIPRHELARLRSILAGVPPPPRSLREAQNKLATDLILEMRQQETAATLDTWMKAPEFETRFKSLDEPNQGRVRSEYASRMRKLKTGAAA